MADQHKTVPLDESNAKAFLDSVDDFVFDCDGVLWTGKNAVPGAEKALEFLRSHVRGSSSFHFHFLV